MAYILESMSYCWMGEVPLKNTVRRCLLNAADCYQATSLKKKLFDLIIVSVRSTSVSTAIVIDPFLYGIK